MREASFWTGQINAVGGVSLIVAGIVMGWLADRYTPPALGKISALGGGVFMILQGVVRGLGGLFVARAGMLFFSGGLDPVFQVWLARSTPAEKRGSVLGWAVTARSLGRALAMLGSAWVAVRFDVPAVFLVGGVLFFLLVPLITWTMKRAGTGRA